MKKCKKGKSCGKSCIAENKVCRETFSDNVSNALDTLMANKVDKVLTGTTKEGTEVEVYIKRGGIAFQINGGYDKADVPDPIAAGKMAMRLAKQILEEVPDNALVWNTPYKEDGEGEMRQRVYEKLGFGEVLGEGFQWAIKKDGKLIPVDQDFYDKRIKGKEKELGVSTDFFDFLFDDLDLD